MTILTVAPPTDHSNLISLIHLILLSFPAKLTRTVTYRVRNLFSIPLNNQTLLLNQRLTDFNDFIRFVSKTEWAQPPSAPPGTVSVVNVSKCCFNFSLSNV
jgi:hypothetical protein